MTLNRYRAGSSRHALWAAFSEGGAKAAFKAAEKIGINASTAKVYIGEWERETEAQEKTDTRIRRVFDIGNPKLIGTIVKAGPEVSEVRWHEGPSQFIPNDKLLPEGFFNPDTKGCYKHAESFAVMELNKRIDLSGDFKRAKRLCAGNRKRFIYAVTKAGLVRMVPRNIWATYPDIPR